MIEKYKDLPRTDPTLLYAEDLLGRAVTLEIEDLSYESPKDFAERGDFLTLRFKGKKKRLYLCKTNVRLFWALFGKDDPKAPIGKQITLQAMRVEAFGEEVDAIRIKGAPWLNEAIVVTVPKGKGKLKMRLVPTRPGAPQQAQEPQAPPLADRPKFDDNDQPPPEHWDQAG